MQFYYALSFHVLHFQRSIVSSVSSPCEAVFRAAQIARSLVGMLFPQQQAGGRSATCPTELSGTDRCSKYITAVFTATDSQASVKYHTTVHCYDSSLHPPHIITAAAAAAAAAWSAFRLVYIHNKRSDI